MQKNIYNAWPKLAKGILKLRQSKGITIPQLDEDYKDDIMVSMKILPYLFPLIAAKNKTNNKNFRPSRLKTQESFFLYIQVISNIQ